jgi:hypothetical protein
MARRLTLVGVFVVIKPGSILQLVVGTTFSATYMLLQVQAGPYALTSIDALANCCSFVLLIFFLLCIAFKVFMRLSMRSACASVSPLHSPAGSYAH